MSFPAPPNDDPNRSNAVEGDVVGPELRALFDLTSPRDPIGTEWDRVNRTVAHVLPQPGPPWRTVGLSLAAGVLLAVGAIARLPGRHDLQPSSEVAREDGNESSEDLTVLRMAKEDDVEIHSVRGAGLNALVVGKSPIPDTMVWAGPKE
jgi:hypothetical protein